MKVLIAAMSLKEMRGPFVDMLRQAGFELVYPPGSSQLTEEELLPQLQGVQASVAGSEPYTRRVMAANPSLRVIARVGVGFDAVDVAAATDHGVAVATTPGANHDGVAEHTFALILALAKGLVHQHLGTQAGKWPRQSTIPLRGRVLGIAGLGRIGKAVALRGECFGMRLLAYELAPDVDFARQHKVTLAPFERLLAESDFLTLHLPLTPESRYLINRRTLAQMKPTAFLINTARGGLVCEADLLEALGAKRLAGAGLDVYENEPPAQNPLLQCDNVVCTPHNAGGDLQARNDMALAAARAVVALSRGEWPIEQIVNPQVRGKFRW
jgi:D-3-phosphoglycerate dehydrogenase / 2-oxoglutarate reductase